MNKSTFIEELTLHCDQLMIKDVEVVVDTILCGISQAMALGIEVEIRGFGRFFLSHHPAKIGRNPKTGEIVNIPPRCMPRFRAGKVLRERVNTVTETGEKKTI